VKRRGQPKDETRRSVHWNGLLTLTEEKDVIRRGGRKTSQIAKSRQNICHSTPLRTGESNTTPQKGNIPKKEGWALRKAPENQKLKPQKGGGRSVFTYSNEKKGEPWDGKEEQVEGVSEGGTRKKRIKGSSAEPSC